MKNNTDVQGTEASFSARLRELMDGPPKTTQETLSKHLGISRQAVSYYTIGQSTPDWKTALSIADYFGVSLDWLFGRKGATKTTDADIATTCATLGVSTEAVENLRRATESTEVYNGLTLSDALDRILKAPGISELCKRLVKLSGFTSGTECAGEDNHAAEFEAFQMLLLKKYGVQAYIATQKEAYNIEVQRTHDVLTQLLQEIIEPYEGSEG